MSEAVQRSGAQEPVGEGIPPLAQVQVGGDERGGSLISFHNEVVEVFVVGGAEGLEAEVVDYQERNPGKGLKAPLVRSRGPGRLEASQELGRSGKENVMALLDDGMPQGLGEVTLSDPAGTNQKDVGRLGDEAGRGQFGEERPVGLRQEGKVEGVERFLGAEAGASETHRVFLLLAAGDFVLDHEGQELGVGEFAGNRLPVPGLEGVEDPGEAELLQQRGQFGHRVHGRNSFRGKRVWVGREKRPAPV